jgi:hypothetical protein
MSQHIQPAFGLSWVPLDAPKPLLMIGFFHLLIGCGCLMNCQPL